MGCSQAAPADGWVTCTHFLPLASTHVFDDPNVPILVLGAGADVNSLKNDDFLLKIGEVSTTDWRCMYSNQVIYGPAHLEPGFRERYPQATHVVAEGQGHCFVDPGWEESVGEPLVKWLLDQAAIRWLQEQPETAAMADPQKR